VKKGMRTPSGMPVSDSACFSSNPLLLSLPRFKPNKSFISD
jgi:hypothetical protein